MYAVCVTFRLHPGQAAAFMPLMLENARQSRNQEPGCQQFDVLHNADAPDIIFLYETYDDRAAFDAHLASVHFKAFDGEVGPMIADKSVQTWDTVQQ